MKELLVASLIAISLATTAFAQDAPKGQAAQPPPPKAITLPAETQKTISAEAAKIELANRQIAESQREIELAVLKAAANTLKLTLSELNSLVLARDEKGQWVLVERPKLPQQPEKK